MFPLFFVKIVNLKIIVIKNKFYALWIHISTATATTINNNENTNMNMNMNNTTIHNAKNERKKANTASHALYDY